MFDLKGTAVFMYKAATYIIIFYLRWFGEINVMKIVNENFFSNDFFYKCIPFPTCHTLLVF